MGAQPGHFVLVKPDGSSVRIALPGEGVLRIGSDSSCQLRLPLRGVAPVEFLLQAKDERIDLVLSSSESRWTLNDGPVPKRHALRHGDVLKIGKLELRYRRGGEQPKQKQPQRRKQRKKEKAPERDPLIGKQIGGYVLDARLGRGAAGTVYKAHQLSLDRFVALKILSGELTEDHRFVEKFLQEARSAARLNHPNVVQVYDAAEEDGVFYFSMEYLPGGSLKELLDRDGSVPVERALLTARDAAEALVWAEERGVVHRDIKPDNLLIAADGTVKVADLGIAVDQRVGSDGRGAGSPRFMAPEQASGDAVDHRADIYALGSTLYYAIAGQPPFDGANAREILQAKRTRDPVPLGKIVADVSPRLSRLVSRMLARDPAKRPSTCVQLLAEIDLCLAEIHGELVTPEGDSGGAGSRGGPSPTLIVGAASAVALVCAILWAVLWGGGGGTEKPADPLGGRAPPSSPPVAVDDAGGGPESPLDGRPAGGDRPADGGGGRTESPAEVATGTGRAEGTESPESELSDADLRVLRQLGDIVTEWRTGLLDSRVAVARIDAFKTRHPSPVFTKRADTILEQIREKLLGENRKRIAEAARDELDPLLDPERLGGPAYGPAAEIVERLRLKFPENEEEISALEESILTSARAHLETVTAEVVGTAESGGFTTARNRLAALAGALPEALSADVDQRTQALDAEIALYTEKAEKLDEARQRARAAMSEGAFSTALETLRGALGPGDGTGAAAGGNEAGGPDAARIEGLALRRLRGESAQLEAEIRLCGEAWESLVRAASAAVDAKLTVTLAGSNEPYELRSAEGGTIAVQAGSERHDELSVLDLSNRSLTEIVGKGDAGSLSGAQLEGLGVLVLQLRGPQRAREILLDSRVAVERRDGYAKRLKEEEGAFVQRVATRTRTEVETLSSAEDVTAEKWSALAETILGRIASIREISAYRSVRAELAAAYVQARQESLRSDVPQSLFRGKVDVDRRDRNSIDLQYRFRDAEEIRDFVPVLPNSTRLEFVQRGLLKARGEFRFAHGNPFRESLTVKVEVPSGGYSLSEPNLNVAIWTHPGDKVTPQYSRSTADRSSTAGVIGETAPEFDDVFVFGVGYRGNKYSTSGYSTSNYLEVHGFGGRPIPMPANAVFGLARGKSLHRFLDEECIWAIGVVGKIKGEQVSRISMSSKSLSWTVNGRSMALQESNDVFRFQREEPFNGSVSFFTNGSVVHFKEIRIEATLDPEWVDSELRRRAIDDLLAVEPNYPFGSAKKSGGSGK